MFSPVIKPIWEEEVLFAKVLIVTYLSINVLLLELRKMRRGYLPERGRKQHKRI